MTASVTLKARKARPFFGRHPWVFEGAIAKVQGKPAPGAEVRLLTHDGEFIAYGLFNPHSNIRVRLYSWDAERPIDAALIARRIEAAVRFRHEVLGLGSPQESCRLVFSESDGLSGLVVDRYGEYLSVQFTSLAMARHEAVVLETLTRLLSPKGIMRRTERGIGELEGLEIDDRVLAGTIPEEPFVAEQNGFRFYVDLRTGQKTGAFLDQRENRSALCRYTQGKRVLDVFCFGGGFALSAMKQGGAASAMGIDTSAAAIALANRNAELNGVAATFVQEEAVPAMQRLASEGEKFDVIVCDPPKFARTGGAVEAALRGYEIVNRSALELLAPGGILLSCSCSGHVSFEEFVAVIATAAQRSGRSLQILEKRSQPADHPISLFCLETEYLKCVIARCAG